MNNKHISRRNFLYLAGLTGTALSFGSILNARSPSNPEPLPDSSLPDLELSLTAVKDSLQVFPGPQTNVWSYKGEIIKGSSDSVQILPNSYLGPILHLTKGQLVRIHFKNELDEPSIIHWHGLHVPEEADGHPRLVIEPGETYTYNFSVLDRAGMYWYHPHPHGRTGPQVYNGLAGLIIISDKEEASLELPSGIYDLPLVIQDRIFDKNNQMVYESSNMMGQMIGFLGDQIMVNGQPEYSISAEARPYRLRLLNGSNSRIYKLAWDDGSPLTIIGTDGGLLEKPIQRDYITLAPAQRIELWANFSSNDVGDEVNLINIPAETPGGNERFQIFKIKIEKEAASSAVLPERLSSSAYYQEADAANVNNPRTFDLAMGMGMAWKINGRTFEMEKVAKDEIVQLGDLEIWEFNNVSGRRRMGMSLPHPMHVHDLQFQILERINDPSFESMSSSVNNGFVDEGWHDTVLVMPGERVRILMKFKDFPGLFLYHCHNLEHEDKGMMRNYLVKA